MTAIFSTNSREELRNFVSLCPTGTVITLCNPKFARGTAPYGMDLYCFGGKPHPWLAELVSYDSLRARHLAHADVARINRNPTGSDLSTFLW